MLLLKIDHSIVPLELNACESPNNLLSGMTVVLFAFCTRVKLYYDFYFIVTLFNLFVHHHYFAIQIDSVHSEHY